MAISVTCPECQYRFHVGEEFAGRPGRCPECDCLIQVPDSPPQSRRGDSEPAEPDPYRSRREIDPFEGRDRPTRRPIANPDDYHDPRDDFDDQPQERAFDPAIRAERWRTVANGFRNLLISVILVGINETFGSVFALVNGVADQQNALTTAQIAAQVGNMLFSGIALIFWAIGRMGCAKVPYVPARGMAKTAGIIALITAGSGVLAFLSLAIGILVMQQNMGLAFLMVMMGGCTFFLTLCGFVTAEIIGLVSQIRMASGLRDSAFGSSSRALLMATIALIVLTIVAMCGIFVWAMTEAQKAQQAQMKNNPAPIAGKGNAPPAPAPAQQQPPPPFDPADHPDLMVGISIGRLIVALAYALLAGFCFHLGRKAVRREIDALVGENHSHDREYH